ncbi:MAG TPA: 50S ribosomal protein L24 [bacterium]|nr:50S ribosomal protein L24 [bacterium]
MKLKKNDNVMVLTGKDRGKSGVIERVFPEQDKLIVKGVGLVKKHVKPSQKNPKGGIIDINMKVNNSNVMIICPSCGKPTKIGLKVSDKVKQRICKRCGQSLEGNTK